MDDDFYTKAMNELDAEFPGATYDESLNRFIYIKHELKSLFELIKCLTLFIMMSPAIFLMLFSFTALSSPKFIETTLISLCFTVPISMYFTIPLTIRIFKS